MLSHREQEEVESAPGRSLARPASSGEPVRYIPTYANKKVETGARRRGAPTTEFDEGRLEEARKARRIGKALRLVEPGLVRVLFAAFGPFARELPISGTAAPVAPMTSTARNGHRASNTNRSVED